MPEWYPLIAAARYLGVDAWDLAERPVAWQQWALAAQAAEAHAEEQYRKHAKGNRGRRR